MIVPAVPLPSREDRRVIGRALRHTVPRSAHANWIARPDRADPLVLIAQSSIGRVPRLIPLRYQRMALSPFAFFRGTANIMAADLADTPASGLRTQICGDAHCANFGAFATPGEGVVFEVNDFDETLPGPWEWDLKRLAASLIVAARVAGLREPDARDVARAAVASYAARMTTYATMTALEIWADRPSPATVLALSSAATRRKLRAAGHAQVIQHRYVRLTEISDGQRRIIDDPPWISHVASNEHEFPNFAELIAQYRDDLREESAALLARYTVSDWAIKVVGVGSVGTRCAAALLLADVDDPLIVQIKEARPSVLEPYLGASLAPSPAARVINGQRLMQTAPDPFLGKANVDGRSYYVRELRAVKGAPDASTLGASELGAYAQACGGSLAAAHARCGDPVAIDAYIGRNDRFARALATFATVYADRVEADFARFAHADQAGTLHLP
jgi:uncharacterized protein (DUF2252 family)